MFLTTQNDIINSVVGEIKEGKLNVIFCYFIMFAAK